MDPDSTGTLTAVAALLLVAVNGFLVAAEFSLIAARRSRLEHVIRSGDARASRVLPALDRLEELAFAAQLGRSAASVTLGVLAVSLGRSWLLPRLGTGNVTVLGLSVGPAQTVATVTAVAAVALLHATLGQQVPKLVAIHRAEWIAARLAVGPLAVLALVLKPLSWVLMRGVRAAVRLQGVHATGFSPLVQTPEEIRILVEQAGEEAQFEVEERDMIRGVFEFGETVAREVMTPRTDVIAVPVDVPLDELVRVATEEGHSRLPVYDGTIDTVVGVLLVKDLLPVLRAREAGERPAFDVRDVMREAYFVPDTKPVNVLLSELRRAGGHLAVVVDEFGGTYGVVTMEDLLEEIVGEIHDEYDVAEPEFAATPEGDVLIDGGAAIGEVNERLGLELPEEDFDTLGGFIFGALGRVPVPGDVVPVAGPEGEMALRVEETEERRVTVVRLTRPDPVAAAPPGG